MPPTKPYKAILAFVGTFLVSLYATVQGRTDLDTMKLRDWGIVVLGSLAVTIAVYAKGNPPKGNTGEGGAVDAVLLLLVAIFVVVVLLLFRVHVG